MQNELELGTTSRPQLDHKGVLRDVRNYLAGTFVGATRDEALLDEVTKALFIQLFLERHPDTQPGGGADGDPLREAKYFRQTFARVKERHPDLFDEKEELLLDPNALAHVMRMVGSVPILDSTRDALGDAFELFVGDHLKSQAGQFFTPRNAVNLLVGAVAPGIGETVIDPACGAGGFLTATLQHLLAEGHSQANVSTFAEQRLFGVDKDQHLTDLARRHLALLSDRSPQVVCADSLAWSRNDEGGVGSILPLGEYDVVLTNPPFGSRIVAGSEEVLSRFELARRWVMDRRSEEFKPSSTVQASVPPQVLFLEQCIRLVKPGGRIGMVVPESLISSSRYRYVVQFLRSKCALQLVAGMPENLFKTSGKGGTHTKTALLVLRKREHGSRVKQTAVYMAEAKWCGHDSRGRSIHLDDLPSILKGYRQFRDRGMSGPGETSGGFAVAIDKIRDDVLAPRQYDPSVTADVDALAGTHEPVLMRDLVEEGTIEISTGDEVGKLAYATGDIPFIRTSDLSNWELKVDAKQQLGQEHYDRLAEKQDVEPYDILMVKDGTYLIGTCAIVMPEDLPLVYQSHIFKLRVRPNTRGLDAYLLLAVLGSPVVQRQIHARRVTQDIIDSLGKRIYDLVLPLPRTAREGLRVSEQVRELVEHRREAKRLLRKVLAVVSAGGDTWVPSVPLD